MNPTPASAIAKRLLLIILDGWGKGKDQQRSAIAQAHTPFMDGLYESHPHSVLTTHGELVGLPEGQMGNSEVGHLNIGAGRVVYQELLRINRSIASGEIRECRVLQDLLDQAKRKGALHLMGLVSDGGVHSHIEHVKALVKLAAEAGVPQIYLHAFTDGRDTDPRAGIDYLGELQNFGKPLGMQIASVVGRYYAMDRDLRWERIKQAYDLLTKGEGKGCLDALQGVRDSYAQEITDEFIEPIVAVDGQGRPLAVIQEGAVLLCFNFRTDRCRQITRALTQEAFPDRGMEPLDLDYATMTVYDDSFVGVPSVFQKENLADTLGEVLSNAGKTQLRIAETEKYPHVTFFFSGGRETSFPGESRVMVPSPKVATYDLQPEMSAPEVTDKAIAFLGEHRPDFVCLNYANADMVGHTGVFAAGIKAVETVDACTARLVEKAIAEDYVILITADHGNADCMINPDGSANTAHTMNPVPLFVLNASCKAPKAGKLADLAPTILRLLGVRVPAVMTGEILCEAKEETALPD